MLGKIAATADANYRFAVLAASTLLLLIGSGGAFIIVVALKPIAQDFGWPRAVPSLAFSMQFVGSGFGGIAMGYVMDRLGMGKPALVGSVMIGCGALAVSVIDDEWQLYAIYLFMIGFLGMGALAAPAMANITRWYRTHRGMAVGIVSSGNSLAGIVWPPIFGYAIDSIGWRETFFWFGVFALGAMLPLSIVMQRRAPRAVPGDGAAATTATSAAPAVPRRRDRRRPARPLTARAMQTALCVAIVGCCVAMALPLGHLVAYVTDLGHPVANAVEILSVMLMTAFLSRSVFVGLLADRFGGLAALLFFAGLQAAMLAVLTFTGGLFALYVVAALFGLGYGGIFPVYAVIVREHLPIAEVGRRTGVVFLFGALAMGFGSWMGGVLFDATGSYAPAFLGGVALNAANLAIIGALILRTGSRVAPAAAG